MKATLTSINPPHTNNIFAGIKIIEWRTFALPDGLHFVYETKKCFGLGKVIGTFEKIRHYTFNSVDEIPDYVIEAGCVPREFLEAYAKGRKLFANVIFNARRFEIPKAYPYFIGYHSRQCLTAPPQSYMYIEVSDNAQYDYINT